MNNRFVLGTLALLVWLGVAGNVDAGLIITDASLINGSSNWAVRVTGDTYQHTVDVSLDYTIPAFGEDVLAFNDRDHEWNGVTAAGLPSFLLGGDYVQTANNARNDLTFEMSVTLGQTAFLYITRNDQFIDAGEVPAWFSDGVGLDFVEVLDNQGQAVFLGIDGDAYASTPSTVGPGVSINDQEKLFLAVDTTTGSSALAPGSYTLYESNTGTKNMYGVIAVVVPEPSTVLLLAMGLLMLPALGWRRFRRV